MAAAEIAYLSNGNMTEALTMLQHEGKSYHTLFVQWLRLCYGNKGPEVMAFVEQTAKLGRENQKNFLRYVISFIRECCYADGWGQGRPGNMRRTELRYCSKNDQCDEYCYGASDQRRAGKSTLPPR